MMERTYILAAVHPVTEQVIPVTATVLSEKFEYGSDRDGQRGQMREEIVEVLVESDTTLPEWARTDAIQQAKYKWWEGR